jgi:hypothetical protein
MVRVAGTTGGGNSAPNVLLWEMTRRQVREGIDEATVAPRAGSAPPLCRSEAPSSTTSTCT